MNEGWKWKEWPIPLHIPKTTREAQVARDDLRLVAAAWTTVHKGGTVRADRVHPASEEDFINAGANILEGLIKADAITVHPDAWAESTKPFMEAIINKVRRRGVSVPLDGKKGGEGSGNFEHAGRPGLVGGSAPGAGAVAERGAARSVAGVNDPAMVAAQMNLWNKWTDQTIDNKYARLGKGAEELTTREAAKALVSQDIGQDIGVDAYIASEMIHCWSKTSNDADYRSLTMQAMAAKEFGVSLSPFQEDRLRMVGQQREERLIDAKVAQVLQEGQDSDALASGDAQYMTPGEWLRTGAAIDGDESPFGDRGDDEVERAFLRAQYNHTQALFKEAGVTEVVLYRGVVSDEVPHSNTEVNLTSNAMESWSTDYDDARGFAASKIGCVYAAVFPVERLLSTPFTGFGCLDEHEFVVLGGPGRAYVKWSSNG